MAPKGNAVIKAVKATTDKNANKARQAEKLRHRHFAKALKTAPAAVLTKYDGMNKLAKRKFMETWQADPEWKFVEVTKDLVKSDTKQIVADDQFKSKIQLTRILGNRAAKKHCKLMKARNEFQTCESGAILYKWSTTSAPTLLVVVIVVPRRAWL